MTPGLRQLWQRHPILRSTLLWALPALAFAAFLRVCFLAYSPLAYWGSDSRSFFDFSFKLYNEHYLSLVEKRRFLYPIFVALVTALPGTPLRWLAWLQHGLGILSILPIAYVIRKTTTHWRWWIVPITILYAGMPILLWYEHELLAETVMFSMVAWAFGGWVAWATEEQRQRAAQLWWWFLVPFACFILIKPSARFFWPGIGIGLLALFAWKKVSRAGLIAGLAIMVVTLFVGSKKQGAWLMYTATFPLTQLETPLHAEYKAQVAEDVRKYQGRIPYYFHEDEWVFSFLENPSKQTERPLWTALEKQSQLKPRVYMDLALEGIKARPDLFFLMGRDRLLASANISSFKESRFTSQYFPERFEDDYRHAEGFVAKGKASYEAIALGLPARGPLPPYPEIVRRLAPRPGSLPERIVTGWVTWYEAHSDLLRWPVGKERNMLGHTARPTALGWYFLLALVIAFTTRRYLRTHAVWVLSAMSYLSGVFLVSQVNPRYFGAAWPVFIPLLALPLDRVWALIAAARTRSGPPADAQVN